MSESSVRNRLLLALPSSVCASVVRHCRYVEFPAGHAIYLAGSPLEHIYFIDCGLVSMIKTMEDGRRAEIGVVGTEGVVGIFSVHGYRRAIVEYLVQVPVSAWRIGAAAFHNEMAKHEAFREFVDRYLFLLVDQIAQTAACNRLHSLKRRCCRWLLLAHDNSWGDQFKFTHELLATLLGVQRPSLSMTANGLQALGLIRYSHGRITILNRPQLEEIACECYHTMRRRTDQVFELQPQ